MNITDYAHDRTMTARAAKPAPTHQTAMQSLARRIKNARKRKLEAQLKPAASKNLRAGDTYISRLRDSAISPMTLLQNANCGQ